VTYADVPQGKILAADVAVGKLASEIRTSGTHGASASPSSTDWDDGSASENTCCPHVEVDDNICHDNIASSQS